jgi:hypothetical protein
VSRPRARQKEQLAKSMTAAQVAEAANEWKLKLESR